MLPDNRGWVNTCSGIWLIEIYSAVTSCAQLDLDHAPPPENQGSERVKRCRNGRENNSLDDIVLPLQ